MTITLTKMNFSEKKIHMTGIKGVGMTALAEILISYGAKITGSDTAEEFHTDKVLEKLGIKPALFSPKNIKQGIDMLIYSSAYPDTHPEREEAKKFGILQHSYGEILAEIFNSKRGVLVAGTHGKTTVTALLGHILTEAGLLPTVLVGGVVINWDSNVRAGSSDIFVAEGDEYQKKFLMLKPEYLVLTALDFDHPDTFSSPEDYKEAFETLEKQTAKKVFRFEDAYEEEETDHLFGRHNRKNIGLAVMAARDLGVDEETARKAVRTFKGVRRRFEIYYKDENLLIADDYAHHPKEISETLKGAREHFPEWKLNVIFEPHTYSRTVALMDEFSKAFKDADKVVLLPIFSSAREKKPEGRDVAGELFEKIKKEHPSAFFGKEAIPELLKGDEKKIVLTMGAGDVWQIARKLANNPENKS